MINRRTFGKAVCLGTSSLLMASAAVVAQEWEREKNLAIGQHLYKSLKWNMVRLNGTLEEKFATLKQIGYDGVELDSPGDIEAAEAVAASEAVGLPIEGVVELNALASTTFGSRSGGLQRGFRQHADGDAVCQAVSALRASCWSPVKSPIQNERTINRSGSIDRGDQETVASGGTTEKCRS